MESWMLTRDRRRTVQRRIASPALPPPPSTIPNELPVAAAEPRPGRHSSGCQYKTAVAAPTVWHTITPSSSSGSAPGRLPVLPKLPAGLEGSCNAAWDLRPARWLHRADSPWLLFGVCPCRSPLGGIVTAEEEEEELDEAPAAAEVEEEVAEVEKEAPAAAEEVKAPAAVEVKEALVAAEKETPVQDQGYKVIDYVEQGHLKSEVSVTGILLHEAEKSSKLDPDPPIPVDDIGYLDSTQKSSIAKCNVKESLELS